MVPKLWEYPGSATRMPGEEISACEEHSRLCQLQGQMCSYVHQMQWF